MDNSTFKPPFQIEQLLCKIHKKRPLEWLCIDKDCPRRLFCSYCVISEHKKIHEEFVSLKSFLSDPFSTFNCLLVNEEEENDEGLTLRQKIDNLIKKNSEKIDKICNSIVSEIYQKFHDIKNQFHEELEKFIVTHEKDYIKLEEIRKQYLNFSKQYYQNTENDQFNIEQIIDGLDILCSKYYSNTEVLDFFQLRVNSLPQILLKDDYKVSIENHNLNNIKWNYFADKCLTNWTFNTKLLPNEFIFSNNDLTAKSKDANHGTTLVGNEIMEQGYHKWSLLVEEKNAEYLNVGIIPVNHSMNYNLCNYLDAYCVSSDNSSYNGTKSNGNFSINKGDIIEMVVDFDEDIFILKNNKFRYEKCNIKGKRVLPYVGFSSNSSSKVTILK